MAEGEGYGEEGDGVIVPLPDESTVDRVAYNQLLDETKFLQEQLNAKQAERRSKQGLFDSLQMAVHVVKCDLQGANESEGRAKYLQHQLWMLEQAHQAEKKYHSALRVMVASGKDSERLIGQNTAVAQRQLDQTNCELGRATNRCIKIQECRRRTSEQVSKLGRRMAKAERARNTQFFELYRNHLTFRETERQREHRQARLWDVTLDMMGDRDVEGAPRPSACPPVHRPPFPFPAGFSPRLLLALTVPRLFDTWRPCCAAAAPVMIYAIAACPGEQELLRRAEAVEARRRTTRAEVLQLMV